MPPSRIVRMDAHSDKLRGQARPSNVDRRRRLSLWPPCTFVIVCRAKLQRTTCHGIFLCPEFGKKFQSEVRRLYSFLQIEFSISRRNPLWSGFNCSGFGSWIQLNPETIEWMNIMENPQDKKGHKTTCICPRRLVVVLWPFLSCGFSIRGFLCSLLQKKPNSIRQVCAYQLVQLIFNYRYESYDSVKY